MFEMDAQAGANPTTKLTHLGSRWFRLGAVICVLGILNAASRQETAVGVCEFAIGISMMMPRLRNRRLEWAFRLGIIALFVGAGVVDLVVGHIAWGISILAVALTFVLLLRYQPSGPL